MELMWRKDRRGKGLREDNQCLSGKKEAPAVRDLVEEEPTKECMREGLVRSEESQGSGVTKGKRG